MIRLIQRARPHLSAADTKKSFPYWFLVGAVFALLTAGAHAEDPPAEKKFDFETDEVTVDVLKPDASVVEVLSANARKSLIRIRLDFIAEIVRSAEDI